MLTLIVSLVLAAGLIFRPDAAAEAAAGALQVCAELIIPSLLPFFTVSSLLSRSSFPLRLSRLLHGGKGIAAYLIGICGGYPLGASAAADMCRNGDISPEEAELLLLFCNNSGPAFIIGAVGSGIFSSPKLGLILYAVHCLSALAVGLCFARSCFKEAPVYEHLPAAPLSEALPEAVKSSVAAVMNVCGFVTVFTVFAALARLPEAAVFLSSRTGFDEVFLRSFLTGILELGSGISSMHGLDAGAENLALAAFLLGFGGLSVHCQTLAVIKTANLKGGLHFSGRLLCGSIAAVIMYLIMSFPWL